MTELIDREIDLGGQNQAWKQEYEAYCWTQYYSLTIETETELEELRASWWMAVVILSTHNSAHEISDWELFENLCDFEADSGDFDLHGAEATNIEFLAFFLSLLHEHLSHANRGIHGGRN